MEARDRSGQETSVIMKSVVTGLTVLILLGGAWLLRYSAPTCRATGDGGDPTCFVTDRWTGQVVVKMDEDQLAAWAERRWPAVSAMPQRRLDSLVARALRDCQRLDDPLKRIACRFSARDTLSPSRSPAR